MLPQGLDGTALPFSRGTLRAAEPFAFFYGSWRQEQETRRRKRQWP